MEEVKMRSRMLLLPAALLMSLGGSAVVHGEAKKPPAKPASEAVRYFQFSGDLLGDLPVDGFLREVRQGGNVISAMLDVCHSISQVSSRKDRFVVPLHVESGKLVGTGQSQEDKIPITVSLARKQTGKTTKFEGYITRGSIKTNISSEDNRDMTEAEFRENQDSEASVDPQPKDFTEISPDSLGIRVKRESLVEIVKKLKSEDVQIIVDSLTPDCPTLRSGHQVVRFFADPERAPSLVAKLKASAEVVTAGWTEGGSPIEDAVRFPAAGWLDSNGRLDREKLAAAIAASGAKTFNATLGSSSWDLTTGELTLKLKIPNQPIPGLDLTDIVVLIGPEKLGSTANLIVWLEEYKKIDTVDEGPEPRFKNLFSEDNKDLQNQLTTVFNVGLARDLKGQVRDSEKPIWKGP
jgi:hypothetical protein